MKIEPDRIFNQGRLFLWDEDNLLRAELEVNPEEVTFLRIGDKCYSCIGLEEIYERIAVYTNVTAIEVADDRIPDQEIPIVERRFAEIFPSAKFKWSYDALAGGKHGR